MRRTTIALLLGLAPGYLAAQSQQPGQSASQPAAEASSGPASAGFSAETRVRLEAMFRAARAQNLPTEPMNDRIAEGQAKGASEAQIIAATRRVQVDLHAAQQALIRAGREQPSDAEVARGAQLIARGASSAQLEALVRQEPSAPRLEVALEVLTELTARGIPVDHALAVVSGRSGLTGTAAGTLGIGVTRKP